MKIAWKLIATLVSFAPLTAAAASTSSQAQEPIIRTGTSGLWILANISYAGMRAQNSASSGWRVVAFIFGFPGTLISLLAIKEGGERAYGIEVPRRGPPSAGA
jgi:hypothetical protein